MIFRLTKESVSLGTMPVSGLVDRFPIMMKRRDMEIRWGSVHIRNERSPVNLITPLDHLILSLLASVPRVVYTVHGFRQAGVSNQQRTMYQPLQKRIRETHDKDSRHSPADYTRALGRQTHG